MTFLTAALCTTALSALVAALLGGVFYFAVYRPYTKKQASKRADAAAKARAGGLAALGQPEQRAPRPAAPAPRPPAPAHS